MIQANELRIGNWVNAHGNIVQVLSIERNGTITHKEIEGSIGTVINQLMPIPLTSGWLRPMGFKQEENKWVGTIAPFHLIYLTQRWKTAPNSFILSAPFFKLKQMSCPPFVHSFQNFIFALTSKEVFTPEGLTHPIID